MIVFRRMKRCAGSPSVIWRKLGCLNPNLQKMQANIGGKMSESGAMPCPGNAWLPGQPPGRGAIPSEGIEGDEWDA